MQPEKIGRYQIRSELGRGGMAIVYLAYDPAFERDVAVKVLPSDLIHSDPQFRARFKREGKIIAQLEHQSIVPVYDVGEENEQPYFVMQYMRGGSLSERIKKGAYSVEETTRILEQIAPGIDEAHSSGIIHRDLKPNNILFDSKGVPHISDFGVAKIMESQSQPNENFTGSGIIGTPAYMAPEQVTGNPVNAAVDIYALGIILFEMLTGKQPYGATTPMGVAVKHVSAPVPRILDVNPNLPAWLEPIISRSMAKDPNDRFESADEMIRSLKESQRDGVPLARPGKQKEKHINPLTVIVPVLIIALLGGGFFLQKWFQSPTPIPTSATPIPLTETPKTVTEESIEIPFTPTATEVIETPGATETSIPPLPVMGGADKIAFLHSNDIWIMNVDGSDLRSITDDGLEKFNLEWLPDGTTILYITGKTIKTVDIESKHQEVITSFGSAQYFESFHISPDGKQVAISLARELHVVPFDLEKFKNIVKRSDLIAMEGCILYNAAEIQDALWSDDGQKLAIKFTAPTGNNLADTIRIIDIHLCRDSAPLRLAEFPGSLFSFSSKIINYDWDGDSLFFLNNDVRNDGFGKLGFYNVPTFLYKEVAPVDRICCYRDAAFSPDGTFALFAFQDIRLGAESPILLYYIPLDLLQTQGTLQPLPLPDGFFTKRNDAPMPILRPAQR
ncbi:MAG: WD40 repeat domain-containing serine/threonine protein kinase [Anaerolineae bacterium]|nr:WD40 repeat domain-containing serine/threonine protein kinase [Anaerolineae bacterium]MCI0610390.1 WD40 repeat domain-containing serine/threonine protein kinase [Anaerolineae bacterium]